MGNRTDVSCSLCLCTIWDKNIEEVGETTKEILDIIFINKNLWLNKGQVICQLCSRKLQDNFNFKCMCIYTEDYLAPFLAMVGTPQINLREVYLRKNGNGRDITDNQKICRLCLQIIYGNATSLLEEREFYMIQKYIPEIVIHNTLHPVACEICVRRLHDFSAFIACCNGRRDNTDEYISNRKVTTDGHKDVEGKYEAVGECSPNAKNEDGCREKLEGTVNDLNLYVKNDDLRQAGQSYNVSSYQLPPPILAPTHLRNGLQPNIPERYDNGPFRQRIEDDEDHKSSILYDLDLHMARIKVPNDTASSETETYDTQRPDYKSKYRKGTKGHGESSSTKAFYCDQCGYRTKYPNALKSHMLNHKAPSEIEMYRCDKCEYRTKYRNALKSHELNHKSRSEIQMRKCTMCSYETKHRTALVLHMLKHKNPSEIEMFKCDKCKFQTKFKHALKPHKLKHKGDT